MRGPALLRDYFVTAEATQAARFAVRPGHLLIAGLVTWIFLAIYWFAIWHRAIAWTTRRRAGTVLSVLAAAAIATPFAFLLDVINADFGLFVASIVAPLSWLMLTIYAWRETPDERAIRLGGLGGSLACPTCGYDLTGLRGTRCPECGTEFTVDELVNARRGGSELR